MNSSFKINKRFTLFLFGVLFVMCFNAMSHGQSTSHTTSRVFLAGAATSNITPKIGTPINANFRDAKVQNIHDEIHARSIVLDDGQTRLSFVVMDLCIVSREILDKAKARAHEETGIPVENTRLLFYHH